MAHFLSLTGPCCNLTNLQFGPVDLGPVDLGPVRRRPLEQEPFLDGISQTELVS